MTSRRMRELAHDIETFAGRAPFTAADAADRGISPDRLAHAVRVGELHRITRGNYALRDEPMDLARHHLGLLTQRGIPGVVGCTRAADSWGVATFGSVGAVSAAPLTILVPPGSEVRRGTRYGVRLRVADIDPVDIRIVDGVPMTGPMRTGLDIARDTGRCRPSALVPLSSGVRAELAWALGVEGPASAREVTDCLHGDARVRIELLASLADMVGRVNGYGMKWVRRVLADVEPLLETALEGLAWSVITATDLPRPQPQVWIRGASGKRYRADFLIAGVVVLEADGAVKYSSLTPWQEKKRQHDLEAAGYWVVRCTWEELLRRPHEVIDRVRLALERATLAASWRDVHGLR
ncbi:MAG: DUF559 domain-containing protein [Actinobacteria bacterium]|nr:DUF559 domain-containing protein [Actinomycetota bacterium]